MDTYWYHDIGIAAEEQAYDRYLEESEREAEYNTCPVVGNECTRGDCIRNTRGYCGRIAWDAPVKDSIPCAAEGYTLREWCAQVRWHGGMGFETTWRAVADILRCSVRTVREQCRDAYKGAERGGNDD